MPEHIDAFVTRMQRELASYHAWQYRLMLRQGAPDTRDAGEWWSDFVRYCEELEDWGEGT